jgi:hypothetical protein
MLTLDQLPTQCELQVGSLSGILLAVGRYGTLEKLYITSRSKRAMSLWEQSTSTTTTAATTTAAAAGGGGGSSATAVPGSPAAAAANATVSIATATATGGATAAGSGGGGSGWLLMFYNSLLAMLRQESSWLSGALPDTKGRLLLALVGAILNKVGGW